MSTLDRFRLSSPPSEPLRSRGPTRRLVDSATARGWLAKPSMHGTAALSYSPIHETDVFGLSYHRQPPRASVVGDQLGERWLCSTMTRTETDISLASGPFRTCDLHIPASFYDLNKVRILVRSDHLIYTDQEDPFLFFALSCNMHSGRPRHKDFYAYSSQTDESLS